MIQVLGFLFPPFKAWFTPQQFGFHNFFQTQCLHILCPIHPTLDIVMSSVCLLTHYTWELPIKEERIKCLYVGSHNLKSSPFSLDPLELFWFQDLTKSLICEATIKWTNDCGGKIMGGNQILLCFCSYQCDAITPLMVHQKTQCPTTYCIFM